ncbi:MAG: hypothetical protein ABJB40_02580, partial [Acidobacteriota bacterium]
MSDLNQTVSGNIEAEEPSSASLIVGSPVLIRVSPHGYFTALLLATFFSAFLFYLDMDLAGAALFGMAWLLLPFFAFYDRISFDGRRLTRTGLIPQVWAWFNVERRSLKIADIEQVETQAIRAVKRGGNIFYRYRTVVRGKGLTLTIASGGEAYRRIVKMILPRLSDNVLDNRSMELRDHLADPKETLMRA